ncbi:ATP-binding cassette domain-containing protein [Gordonia aichiensis]
MTDLSTGRAAMSTPSVLGAERPHAPDRAVAVPDDTRQRAGRHASSDGRGSEWLIAATHERARRLRPGNDATTDADRRDGPGTASSRFVGLATSGDLRDARITTPETEGLRRQQQSVVTTPWERYAEPKTRDHSAVKTQNFSTPETQNAIEARDLRKSFGEMTAVESVSFSVKKGSILALLGPNGAGKTTTVNMLCTLLRPDGGTASVAGHDVVDDAPAVRRSIMLTGQFAALDESLTGKENLVLFGRLLGLSRATARKRAADLLDQFGLGAAADRRVSQYSGGMRRRIDIACGLVRKPEVVFLDEPTTGLDPRSRQEVWRLVETLRDSGVTTLLTTQYLEEADALSDHIVVIDHGRVIASGTADELKTQTGDSYCEVTPLHAADIPRLKDLLAPHSAGSGARTTSEIRGRTRVDASEADDTVSEVSLAVPAPEGPRTLMKILNTTDAAGIQLSDISLRRPSLDEVFLALTEPDRVEDAGSDGNSAR